MKKTKILIAAITIIMLILVCIIRTKTTYGVYIAPGFLEKGNVTLDYFYNNNQYQSPNRYAITNTMMKEYTNIYCTQHHNEMRGNQVYRIAARVEIDEHIAKFYTYDKEEDAKTSSGTLKGTFDDTTSTKNYSINRLLAAIICDESIAVNNDIYFGFRYSEDDNAFCESQKLLWYIWNDWVEASGASAYGFETWSGNDDVSDSNLQTLIDNATEKAENYSYKATFYYMVFRYSNTSEDQSDGQSLIIVTSRGTPTPDPVSIDIPVTKKWYYNGKENADEQYGNRPTEITVTLRRHDGSTPVDEEGNNVEPLKLNSGNKWSGTFTNLPGQASEYYIEETRSTDRV